MPLKENSAAVAAARALVEAGDRHDYDAVRATIADDVALSMVAADAAFPKTELNGVEPYMRGLIRFKDAVVAGSTEVVEALGDDKQALLRVNSKVRISPHAPEMDARSARMYVLNDAGKIKTEHVLFFLT